MLKDNRDNWHARARQCIEQHPLLKTKPSIAGLRWLAKRQRVEAVVVGIGLCSPEQVSRGVPVDLLGMLLPADALRRAVGARRLTIIIADTHAIANGFAAGHVDAQSQRVESALRGLVDQSILPAIDYVRASSYHGSGDYRRIYGRIRGATPERHEYVDRQLADILYLRQQLGPLIKVGWLLDGTLDQPRWRDEGAFDCALLDYFDDEIGFVYGRPGRSLWDEKPRMPPYVAVEPARRICLDASENAAEKLRRARVDGVADETIRGCRGLLKQIVYCYNRQVRSLPRGTLEHRVQSLIDEVTVEAETLSVVAAAS